MAIERDAAELAAELLEFIRVRLDIPSLVVARCPMEGSQLTSLFDSLRQTGLTMASWEVFKETALQV